MANYNVTRKSSTDNLTNKEEKIMMKSQFAQAVAQKVNGEVREVEKANGIILTGISVKSGSIAPTVYIDDFYEDELNIDETAEKVREMLASAMDNLPVGVEALTDWERVKPLLRARLYNERTNADVRKPAGYGLDDLVIIPYIEAVFTDGGVNGSVKVTNELLTIWKVTADDVISIAETNSKNDFSIRSISEVIAEMTGMPPMPMDDEPLVVTNNNKMYGAYALIAGYEALKERFPNGFTVLPSSVHEVLVTGASDDRFSDMVSDVNDTAVDPQEVLGCKAYWVA